MEAQRCVELTSTNSPCVLYLNQNFLPPFQYIHRDFLAAMERRVHPIPFRTRQLSSLSPMILHIIMWESRSPPRIFAQAPSSFRAPGLFALLGLKPKRPNCRPANALNPVWCPDPVLLTAPLGAGRGRPRRRSSSPAACVPQKFQFLLLHGIRF